MTGKSILYVFALIQGLWNVESIYKRLAGKIGVVVNDTTKNTICYPTSQAALTFISFY